MVVLPHALCREIGGMRRRDERLDALAPDEVQELLAPLDVELAHDIVEQQDGVLARLGAQELELGELQREHAGALLSLRAEGAQVDAVDRQHDVFVVGNVARRTAQDVRLLRFPQHFIIP